MLGTMESAWQRHHGKSSGWTTGFPKKAGSRYRLPSCTPAWLQPHPMDGKRTRRRSGWHLWDFWHERSDRDRQLHGWIPGGIVHRKTGPCRAQRLGDILRRLGPVTSQQRRKEPGFLLLHPFFPFSPWPRPCAGLGRGCSRISPLLALQNLMRSHFWARPGLFGHVRVPVDGIPALRRVERSAQPGATSKLAEDPSL